MKLIEVECEICTFPLGVIDIDAAVLPMRAGMFKPISAEHKAAFPDYRAYGLERDLVYGEFKCPQCRKVPFIKPDRIIDKDKQYHIIKDASDIHRQEPEPEPLQVSEITPPGLVDEPPRQKRHYKKRAKKKRTKKMLEL